MREEEPWEKKREPTGFVCCADVPLCDLVQSEIACCIVISWINSISMKSYFCVWCYIMWSACVSEWARMPESAASHSAMRKTRACSNTYGESTTVGSVLYWEPVDNDCTEACCWLRETSPHFDVLQPLFIESAEEKKKRDGELKNTVSHILFPLTSLLLSNPASLKVNRLESPHSAPYLLSRLASRLQCVPFRRDVCVIYQRDAAAWRHSLPAIWGTPCVSLAFMHMHSKEACTNNTIGGDTVTILQRFFQFVKAIVAGVISRLSTKPVVAKERKVNQPTLFRSFAHKKKKKCEGTTIQCEEELQWVCLGTQNISERKRISKAENKWTQHLTLL